MSKKGRTKEVFPGGNTYKGFHSFYDYIIPEDANRIFVIKGGPGVGKSTFMKYIAQEFANMGLDVELHHCSSDNNSLDGVVIPAARVALIDGTAPHIVDPKNPGAVDEILNLGEYWNEEGMVRGKDNILKCNREVKNLFNSAYHYLAGAKEMQDDIEAAMSEAVDHSKVNGIIMNLKCEFISDLKPLSRYSRARHLFDSAITPDGVWDYIETIIPKDYKCCFVKGECGADCSKLLNALSEEYLLKGYDVEVYHQPLNPDRLQTIVVEDLKIAFSTNQYASKNAIKQIDLDESVDKGKLEAKRKHINTDKQIKEMLMEEAINRIRSAKTTHDEMEKNYVPNMNFEEIHQLRQKTINRIKKILDN